MKPTRPLPTRASWLESWFAKPGRSVLRVVAQRILAIGHWPALPTAHADFRSGLASIYGGAGVADRTVICEKNTSDTYDWNDIGRAALDSRYVNTLLPTDPNADRIYFWDDSAGSEAYLAVGSGLAISGTTLSATGITVVQEGDADVDVTVTTLDFDASDFNLTESPEDEINIALNYGTGAGQPAEGNHTHSPTITATVRSTANSFGNAASETVTVACNAGEIAVGGGYDIASGSHDFSCYESNPTPTTGTPTGWNLECRNDTGASVNGTVYVICLDTTPS